MMHTVQFLLDRHIMLECPALLLLRSCTILNSNYYYILEVCENINKSHRLMISVFVLVLLEHIQSI